jgi:hypothetical protein
MAGGRVKGTGRIHNRFSGRSGVQQAPRQRSTPEGPRRRAARLRPRAQESVTRPAGGGRPNLPRALLQNTGRRKGRVFSIRSPYVKDCCRTEHPPLCRFDDRPVAYHYAEQFLEAQAALGWRVAASVPPAARSFEAALRVARQS